MEQTTTRRACAALTTAGYNVNNVVALYVPTAIFRRYKRIRTYLLLENTSYSYRMLCLEKVANFLSHSNKRSEQ